MRGYRFRGIFNDEPINGLLGSRRVGDVESMKAYASRTWIDIVYCALPGTRKQDDGPDGIL
ncbi:MAG: hypothetical protein IPI81_17075 [Flavobacteriales bacterium]|nr:hypothetical protein [Flavobacteriales bacterium]